MKCNNKIRDFLLLLLAIIFSVALMFTFIELPRWIESLLSQNFGFPGFDQGESPEAAYHAEVFIEALGLKWIGYASLILVCLFIILGFVTKKSTWALAGALIIFLPVFAQFAYSMFFLSGLGILRAGWLPFMQTGFPLLDLGMVIYIPYWVLLWFFGLFNWYAHNFISWLFMSVGAFLFVWGVFVWLQSRLVSKGVATQWIYKISRHPQYLGWIVWSYGLMIYSSTINDMKKSWGDSTSLPWLISTMIIIAICMLEELKMKDEYGEEYEVYRKKAPFLFPIPKWLKHFFKFPMNLVTKEVYLQNKKQVLGVILIYTFLFIAVSLFWVDFGNKQEIEIQNSAKTKFLIDSITNEIQYANDRRTLYRHFEALGNLGAESENPLIIYLSDFNPVKREFAADQLGKLKDTIATQPLVAALNDENWRVVNSAAIALSKIGNKYAIKPIIELVRNTPPAERTRYYSVLGSLGAEEAWPYLVEGTANEKWYLKNSALIALTEINPQKALPFVFEALQDSNFQVRRSAVFILLKLKPAEAIQPLKEVLNDEDFETRFYAKQALRLIEEKNNL